MSGKLKAKMIDRYGPGRHGDGTGCGLALVVQPSGSRSYVQRLVIRGRRVLRGLGSARAIGLQEARTMALENYRAARRGLDPFRAEATPATVPTFEQAAAATYEHFAAKWADGTRRTWWGPLRQHVLSAFGARAINEISKGDVVDVLTPIWTAKPAAADTVLRTLRQVFRWSRDHDHIATMPTDTVTTLLPARATRKTKSHAAVPVPELPAFLDRVEAAKSTQAARDAVRLCVFLACRPSEIRNLTWDAVDLDKGEITLDSTKQKRQHVIPVSTEADRILESRPRTGRYVFTSPRTGRPMSPMGLDRTMQAAAPGYTLHGTARAAFSTWAHETGRWAHDAVEACLGHRATGNAVSHAYNRAEFRAQRAEIMNAWAAYLLTGRTPAPVAAPITRKTGRKMRRPADDDGEK